MKRLNIDVNITAYLPEGVYMENVIIGIEKLLAELKCAEAEVDLRAMDGLDMKATSWL